MRGGNRCGTSTGFLKSTFRCCTSRAGTTMRRSARRRTSPACAPRGGRRSGGPWGHQVTAGRTLGELDFGHDAVIDLDAAMTGFLDEVVRGRPPAEPSPPVRIFLMGANRWVALAGWPPPTSAERVLHLDSAGNANSRYGDGRLRDGPGSS